MIDKKEIIKAFELRDQRVFENFNKIFDFIDVKSRKSLELEADYIDCPIELKIIQNVHDQLGLKVSCPQSLYFELTNLNQATVDSVNHDATWINFNGNDLRELQMRLFTTDKIGMPGCKIKSFSTLLAKIPHLNDFDLSSCVIESFKGMPRKVDQVDMDRAVFENGLDSFPDFTGILRLNMATTLKPLTIMTHEIGQIKIAAKATMEPLRIIALSHALKESIYEAAARLIEANYEGAATL